MDLGIDYHNSCVNGIKEEVEENVSLVRYQYSVVPMIYTIDSKEEIRSGVVAADTITEAMEEIEDYYGDEIMEVQMLKAITDYVFEFQDVMEYTDFDFVISKKV